MLSHENEDISAHAFESARHPALRDQDFRENAPCCIASTCTSAFFERGRPWQIQALVDRIRATVPRDAPMIIAGDFNDWRRKADRRARPTRSASSRCSRSSRAPGPHVPVGAAGVPPRPHLCARTQRDRRRASTTRSRPHGCRTTRRSRPPSRSSAGGERAPERRAGPAMIASRPATGSNCWERGRVLPRADGGDRTAAQAIWLETYIFADDGAGTAIAAALVRAARRGAFTVRLLVDGWGAKHYLTRRLETLLRDGGVVVSSSTGPRSAPWQFRFHRLRRLPPQALPRRPARRLRRRHQPDRRHEHAAPKPPRVRLRGARVRARCSPRSCRRCSGCGRWSSSRAVRPQRGAAVSGSRSATARAGTQTAKFVIRDNLRYRREIERAYLAAIRTAKQEILIANAYLLPGRPVPPRADRGRGPRRQGDAAAAGARRVPAAALRVARALRAPARRGRDRSPSHRSFLHAKVAVIDERWATVGSSNIDPYSLLMAREANVFVRDPHFADQLRIELLQMIDTGTKYVERERWAERPLLAKAVTWIAYGVVRLGMGLMGYGGDEWFPRRRRPARSARRPGRRLLRSTSPARRRRGGPAAVADRSLTLRHAPPFVLRAVAGRPQRAAHEARRLGDDPHAAALPVGVQGARARRDRVPRARQGRQRRRAGAAEADRRQPRPRDRRAGRAAGAARRVRRCCACRRRCSPSCASSCSRRSRSARCARSRCRCSATCTRCRCASTSPADGRPDARRRARPARHLHAHQLRAVLDPADAGRDHAGVGDPDRALRLDVHGDHRRRARPLHRVHRARSPSGARTSGAR